MDVYGLTGGIGSGKSSVAEFLEDFGVPVVSADELSRVVVTAGSEGLAEVVRAFGSDVVDERGELDRRKMASIVFREPARRQQLEAILHPRIRERFEQVLDALEKAGHPITVYEVPLLFEKNLQSDMKATILVTATEETRITRVMERDQTTKTEVRDRIASQMPESLKRKRADYIIENDGSVDELRREVRFLLERFLRLDARGPHVVPVQTPQPPEAPSSTVTQVPTTPADTPSRTPTQVPGEQHQPPSSVGTQPQIPPAESTQIAPPPAPPGARVPTPSGAPPPPPGLHVPVPTPVPGTHAPITPQPSATPAPPPADPAALPPTTTQRAPVVKPGKPS
ncbi:MAG: dephospho-CoA kinase [Nannocystales bacterium]